MQCSAVQDLHYCPVENQTKCLIASKLFKVYQGPLFPLWLYSSIKVPHRKFLNPVRANHEEILYFLVICFQRLGNKIDSVNNLALFGELRARNSILLGAMAKLRARLCNNQHLVKI